MRILPKHIEPRLKAGERFGAVEALLEKLVQTGAVQEQDYTALLEALIEREAVLSTGVGRGLAVPHTQSAQVAEPQVAFGFSPDGIDFAAPDGQPVYFVFLFVLPPGGFEAVRDFPRWSSRLDFAAIRACTTGEAMAKILNGE